MTTRTTPQQGLLTTREAADYLRISTRTLARLVAGKQVAVTRIGSAVRFRVEALDRFAARQETPEQVAPARGHRRAKTPAAITMDDDGLIVFDLSHPAPFMDRHVPSPGELACRG